uniref:Uncharacterized protein n=1 Tax=Physcomitrium patens TaxID=3218 RepID=A0A2K1J153_PHYPA|nr:hypothetical protein PHYPA_023159 [Physcomitrium patens]
MSGVAVAAEEAAPATDYEEAEEEGAENWIFLTYSDCAVESVAAFEDGWVQQGWLAGCRDTDSQIPRPNTPSRRRRHAQITPIKESHPVPV